MSLFTVKIHWNGCFPYTGFVKKPRLGHRKTRNTNQRLQKVVKHLLYPKVSHIKSKGQVVINVVGILFDNVELLTTLSNAETKGTICKGIQYLLSLLLKPACKYNRYSSASSQEVGLHTNNSSGRTLRCSHEHSSAHWLSKVERTQSTIFILGMQWPAYVSISLLCVATRKPTRRQIKTYLKYFMAIYEN